MLTLACLIGLFSGCKGGSEYPLPTAEASPRPTQTPPATPAPAPTPHPNPFGAPEFSLGNFPAIDGSTATIPLALALIQASTGCTLEEAEAKIDFSTTDYSYLALAEGGADLLLVYEASETIKKELDLKNNADLYPIGKDALVFIVNADNPVESLTVKQIQDIYSGRIKNWKQVGGADMPIVAFQRPELSGSQTMMQKLVMEKTRMMDAPSEIVASDMSGLLSSVASYDNTANAIGYSVYYYAKNMYVMPSLKFIAVDSITPTEQSIAADSYPFVNEFFGVLPKEPKQGAKRLLDWLLTPDGQAFVASCGYVSLSGEPPSAPLRTGQPFWDEAYFAVLPHENRTMAVYDCLGQRVGIFSLRGLGQYWFNAGLYTADALAERVLFINGTQLPLAPETIDLHTERYENGFYRHDMKNGILYMYDKSFRLRYKVSHASLDPHTHYRLSVKAIGENDWISLATHYSGDAPILPQVRTKTGEKVSCPALETLGESLFGMLGEKYLIGYVASEKNARSTCSIYDYSGKIVVENVLPVKYLDPILPQKANCRYYIKGEMLYDADLKALHPAQVFDRDYLCEIGGFINGIFYDIDGVVSSGHVSDSAWGAFIQGYFDGCLFVKRGEEIIRFAVNSRQARLLDLNDNFALFYDEYAGPNRYKVIFLKSGGKAETYREISLGNNYYVTGDWLKGSLGHYLIDKNGRLRFLYHDVQLLRALPGDVVLLERGAYIGIADLDGNWLVKNAVPELPGSDTAWW